MNDAIRPIIRYKHKRHLILETDLFAFLPIQKKTTEEEDL